MGMKKVEVYNLLPGMVLSDGTEIVTRPVRLTRTPANKRSLQIRRPGRVTVDEVTWNRQTVLTVQD
jgi:hypothetical protein